MNDQYGAFLAAFSAALGIYETARCNGMPIEISAELALNAMLRPSGLSSSEMADLSSNQQSGQRKVPEPSLN